QVDYMCEPISDIVQQAQAGTMKVYTSGASDRNPALPDVPTAKESGLPQFAVSAWYAMFAPKGTPAPVLDTLTDALDKALDDDAVRKRPPAPGCWLPAKPERGQAALTALIKTEVARWTPIIRAANTRE